MIGFLRRYQLWGLAFGGALVAVILYWPSLTLPVIYDDLLHIRIAKGLNLATVWLPTEQFGFYRPLTFLPLLLIKQIFGYHPSWLLHGINVFQHALNVILLITLSWRLGHGEARALITGLFFALFPFSYQAIAVYGHNVHPTTTGLILLGLHGYLSAVRCANEVNDDHPTGGRCMLWWSGTGAIFLLSLLSHESAVLFGAFAAFIHWNDNETLPVWRRSARKLSDLPPWLIFLLLGVLYAAAYQFLPISLSPQGAGEGGGSLWTRGIYVLQAAAYPLSWFAHILPTMGANTLVLVSIVITAGLSAWMARRYEHRLPLLLGWGWWGLSSLILVVSLPTNYLLHGPRLLYLGSAGVAGVWALIVTGSQTSVAGKAWMVLATGFILVTSWQFVRGRLSDYARLTSPVTMMAQEMADRPPDEGIVIINLPQWLSPPRNTYAVGAELVAMLGDYLFVDEIVVENVSGEHAVYSVVVPDLMDSTAYPYGIHDERKFRPDRAVALPIPSNWEEKGSQVFAVEYSDSGPRTTHVGAFRPANVETSLATMGPYHLMSASARQCEGQVETTLVWTSAGDDAPSPTTSIFVQLLAPGGRFVAQEDGPPLWLRPDMVQLRPGWEIVDRRVLQPAEDEQPAQILVGAYDYVTGGRLLALDSLDAPLPDNAFRLPVTACP